VRVVGVCGVQSHLRAELAQPIDQCIGATLWVDYHVRKTQRMVRYTISLFPKVFRIDLFITLDSMLQKKSSGVQPHYLDVWLPAHDGDADVAEKLVSNNIKCYT
jgi:hypothetical protein